MTFALVLLVGLLHLVSCHEGREKRQAEDRGPLYDYVFRDDPTYSWFQFDSVTQELVTTYYINLTSQTWYNEDFSDRPVWWHYLVVHVPHDVVYSEAGLLYISSGNQRDGPPGLDSDHVARTATYAGNTGIVTAVIRQIPNQPVIFEGDGIERTEDTLIAWTWRRFYNETHDGIDNPEVLARMPMCKASARAMDTIQDLVYQLTGNAISKFMVAGLSKRGWTTWLMGGIDDRIVALVPVVLSCLNMNENFHHYWRSLGGWSWTLIDYWLQRLMGLIDEPETAEMQQIIDPYFYRQWLTMPKLMVSGASDEFFMVDDYDYFFNDLLGEKYIWIMENSGHSINDGPLYEEYWGMLETFYISVLTNYQRPYFEWVKNATETGGQIIVLSPTPPLSITAFSAPSVVPNRRDWRLEVLEEGGGLVETNVQWTAKPVEGLGNDYYRVQYDNPAEGYLAFFIRLSYAGPNGGTFYFTTEANIIPNTWPYADCAGSECQGTLV